MHLGKKLLTLDASESYNPNEKASTKNLIYTWECNIPADDICKKTTSTSNYNINKLSSIGMGIKYRYLNNSRYIYKYWYLR